MPGFYRTVQGNLVTIVQLRPSSTVQMTAELEQWRCDKRYCQHTEARRVLRCEPYGLGLDMTLLSCRVASAVPETWHCTTLVGEGLTRLQPLAWTWGSASSHLNGSAVNSSDGHDASRSSIWAGDNAGRNSHFSRKSKHSCKRGVCCRDGLPGTAKVHMALSVPQQSGVGFEGQLRRPSNAPGIKYESTQQQTPDMRRHEGAGTGLPPRV